MAIGHYPTLSSCAERCLRGEGSACPYEQQVLRCAQDDRTGSRVRQRAKFAITIHQMPTLFTKSQFSKFPMKSPNHNSLNYKLQIPDIPSCPRLTVLWLLRFSAKMAETYAPLRVYTGAGEKRPSRTPAADRSWKEA